MTQMEHNLSKLPDICYSRLPSTGQSILLKKGEAGYWPTEFPVNVEERNALIGVSKEQAEAMFAGSMFCWGSKGADPDTYIGRV